MAPSTPPEEELDEVVERFGVSSLAVVAGIIATLLAVLVWAQVRTDEIVADSSSILGSTLVASLGLCFVVVATASVHYWQRHTVVEERLTEREKVANTDELTGLLNKAGILDQLQDQLDPSGPANGAAVLFMDLDRFKMINDSLGHSAGDEMLQAVAERLRTSIRSTDEVARYGGDEFVVLCRDVSDVEDVIMVAEKVSKSLLTPVQLRGLEPVPGASIGIAVAEAGDDIEPLELLRNADTAMFRAKKRGRGGWALFDSEIRQGALFRLETDQALRKALENDEFRLLYQPVVDVNTRRLVSLESLLRWDRPGHTGLVTPAEFLGDAEEAGLMFRIGEWVLREACTQVAHWRRLHDLDYPIPVSVNVSHTEVSDPNYPALVQRILEETGLQPDHLVLEVKENHVIERVEYSIDGLEKLRPLGVKIAVDDYGKGFASISYMKSLDFVSQLKVHPKLVAQLANSEADLEIVRAIISVANALDKATIAEGVESEEQFNILRQLGVTAVQGTLLGAPVDPTKLGAALVARDEDLAQAALQQPTAGQTGGQTTAPSATATAAPAPLAPTPALNQAQSPPPHRSTPAPSASASASEASERSTLSSASAQTAAELPPPPRSAPVLLNDETT